MKKYLAGILFLIFLFSIFLPLTGCMRVTIWMLGVRSPKVENRQELEKWYTKMGIDTGRVFFLKEEAYKKATSDFNNDNCYDAATGRLVDLNTLKNGGCAGAARYGVFAAPNMDSLPFFGVEKGILENHINLIDLNIRKGWEVQGTQLYYIVMAGKFMGVFNRKVVEIYEECGKKKEFKITPIILNCDILDTWSNPEQYCSKLTIDSKEIRKQRKLQKERAKEAKSKPS